MKKGRLQDIDIFYLLEQYYVNLEDYPIFSTLASLQAGGEDGYTPHAPKLLEDISAIGSALSKLTKYERYLMERFYWAMRLQEECRTLRRIDSVVRLTCFRKWNGEKKYKELKSLSGRYENKAINVAVEVTRKREFKQGAAKFSRYMLTYDPRLYLLKM